MGKGISAALLALLLTASAAVADSIRTIALPANDLIYDARAGRVYASVPSRAGRGGNSVTAIDPESGAIIASVFVGSEPDRLALSDDGRYLYVALDGPGAVQRLDLPSLTPGPRFSLGFDPEGDLYTAQDLQVQPGHPEVVAVSRQIRASPRHAGVAIFDHGAQRAAVTKDHDGPNLLAFAADPERLYGLSNEGQSDFYQMTVDAAGVRITQTTPVYGGGFAEAIQRDGDRIYTAFGWAIDAPSGRMAGRFPDPSPGQFFHGPFVVDAAAGRIYYLVEAATGGALTLRAYAAATFRPLGSQPLAGVTGPAHGLIQWGPAPTSAGGLAFRTDADQVVLVRTPLVPTPALTLSFEPAAVQAGQDVTGRLELQQSAPAGGAVVTLSSDSPAARVPARLTLPAGATTAAFPVTTAAGSAAAAATVSATLGGETALAPLTVLPPPGRPRTVSPGSTVQSLNLPSDDLLYDPLRQLLWVSVPGRAGGLGNSLARLDPARGALLGAAFIGSEPGKLALSDDGQYLYAGLDGAAAVVRRDLSGAAPDLRFWLGDSGPYGYPYYAVDLKVVPGNRSALAVSRRDLPDYTDGAPAALYDDGVPRPATAAATALHPTGELHLQFAGPSVLFSHDGQGLIRMAVDAAGLRNTDYLGNLAPSIYDVRFDDGRLYLDSGVVVDAASLKVVGTYPGIPSGSGVNTLVAPDSTHGRVYFLVDSGPTRQLLVEDVRDFRLLGSLVVPGVAGVADHLLRWGPDGLAFRTDQDQLFLIRSPLISGVPTADLAVARAAPLAGRQGEPLTYTVTLFNAGPDAATGVTVTDMLPEGLAFVSAVASQGSTAFAGGVLTGSLGTLAAGASATVRVTVRPLAPGSFTHTASVRAEPVDPDPSNDAATQSVTVQPR